MEAMGPWLLMIIAALIALCVALYYQARQVQSEAGGTQRFIADELRDAEAGLVAALERIQRMDSVLAAREKAIAAAKREALVAGVTPIPPSLHPATGAAESAQPETQLPNPAASAIPSGAQSPSRGEVDGAITGEDGRSVPAVEELRNALDPNPTGPAHDEWRARAVGLAVAGLTPLQIARELELPVGEVELALALGTWHRSSADGTSASSTRWH